MGDVDELNSSIGVLLCETMPDEVRKLLVEVQHQLFNLGGELSIPGYELLKSEAVALLDAALEEHNAALPRLAEFILPAGSRAAVTLPRRCLSWPASVKPETSSTTSLARLAEPTCWRTLPLIPLNR